MTTATKKDISKTLEESTKERFANELNWNEFLENNNIELVDQKDLVHIVNDKNAYVCVDPSDTNRYLKMSEEFVDKFANNPYFDKPVTNDILIDINNSLSETEKSLVSEMDDWRGTSKEIKVNLPVEISCDWECEHSEDLVINEWGRSRREIDWDVVKQLEEEALSQFKQKVREYESLVSELAKKFKVDKQELFLNLVGVSY